MPFHFVQLSSLNRPSWPHFRDSQRRLANKLRSWDNTVHMVVSSDLGDSTDVHPRRKKPIGERLAWQALSQHYNHPNRFGSLRMAQSPRVIDGERHHDTVFVDFNLPLATWDDEPIRGFEIEVSDGKFYPVTGRIEGKQVILMTSSPLQVAGRRPRIRYGWQPFTRANLCGAGPYRVPVSTFEIGVRYYK